MENSTLENRLRRVEDILAIQQLFVDYGHFLDAGLFDEYADLFARDGEVQLGALGTAKGREAIRAMIPRSNPTN